MCAVGRPGIRAGSIQSQVGYTGFSDRYNHGIAPFYPVLDLVNLWIDSLEVQTDLLEQGIFLRIGHTCGIADIIGAVILDVPLLCIGNNLGRAYSGRLAWGLHSAGYGAGKKA